VLAFILTRLANAFLVMLAVAFVAFSLFNFVGDPVTNMLGRTPRRTGRPTCVSPSVWTPHAGPVPTFLQHAVRGDSACRSGTCNPSPRS